MSKNKDAVQNLRRSQFILTFGPGALIEGVNGPRLIPSLRTGLSKKKFDYYVNNNEVLNLRMSYIVQNDKSNEDEQRIVKFFKLPTNASEGKSDNEGLYRTFIFPVWKICYGNHGKKNHAILYDSSKYDSCPITKCDNDDNTYVRFVCACPDGHLDEVPWFDCVHDKQNHNCNHKDYFYWDANGSSLANIKITCPKCGAQTNMQKIYTRYIPCTGRFPEKESFNTKTYQNVSYSYKPYRKSCKNRMAVIQRQSTSLRVANTLTLLKIPQYEKPIMRALEYPDIMTITQLSYGSDSTDEKLYLNMLSLVKNEHYKNQVLNYIDKKSFEGFLKYAKSLYEGDYSLENVLLQEFKTLRGKSQTKDYFYKSPLISKIVSINGIDFPFEVASVEKITTVTAQIGYQRKPYLKKEEDDVTFASATTIFNGQETHDSSGEKCIWYPVYDAVGEGIFITSDVNPISHFNLKEVVKDWINHKPKFKVNDEYVKNPLFVWWHSFSHALIRTLSFKSGYSAASIRERVYVDLDKGIGGVLLYTTSTGDDCGFGGLISTVDKMDDIIKEAFESIKICSFDPLCYETRISQDKVNGAACVYCLMLPETSCEHNNMWLDRHLLLGD